ncbi:hypothetical protein SARC_00155 [Sphaeroforma arctica JP610]|uniref:Uncharacterized protein n=1 Tax=Sphaeroforma arctica JP610 TaxID=667725 RepID=A0A0L0GFW3_9EUKA|nr:hypothetical protein SARC_00155 [Sphaeroforma arctica JP610]KNC87721.1 hypothetical protein SARC_00155 [Sphaeroforma arctica JP610]|eukprot:XP_014161623.1 hypothetical protein SARC_00155 [Sphaeroforma arctica JP610]
MLHTVTKGGNLRPVLTSIYNLDTATLLREMQKLQQAGRKLANAAFPRNQIPTVMELFDVPGPGRVAAHAACLLSSQYTNHRQDVDGYSSDLRTTPDRYS